jgi:sugar phosphate isomerase/epimerase
MAQAGKRRLMQLALPGAPYLTYCTNIHQGETWPEIEAKLAKYLPEVKARVSPGAAMGVGLRLSGQAAASLSHKAQLGALRAFLAAHDLYVFTINAFPYGPFHGQQVKEQVYEPDWRTAERLAFTNGCADILAALLGEGQPGSVSTVPGAFKSKVRSDADVTLMAETMVRHAAYLHGIAERTGKLITLALEPEPCCLLETTDEAIAFFEDRLFASSAVALMSGLTGLSAGGASMALRRHLGLCFDVCHAAVEFENPRESLAAIAHAGIRVAKIQLSSALKLSHANGETESLLRPFDDGIYLHQTVESRDGRLTRHADLPDAFAALNRGEIGGGEWRVHCHVPVFLESFEGFGSTQDVLMDVLALCRESAVSPHLEVETYTWSVLPEALRTGDLGDDIAREVQWVRSQLHA